MSIKPPIPDVCIRNGPYALSPFDKKMAPVVASWVPASLDLFWLAPNTPPPLTAAKVMAWAGPNASPLLLNHEDFDRPLGYLELNPMPNQRRALWLGHCIIDPNHRGSGLGRLMVEMMLDEAFLNRKAELVHLVVFPENTPAIHCYRRTGFVDAGEQLKHFHTTGRYHTMLHMTVHRSQYKDKRGERKP